jgi:hypothetical protein
MTPLGIESATFWLSYIIVYVYIYIYIYIYYIRKYETIRINLVIGVLFCYQCGIRLLLFECQYCTGTLFYLTIVDSHYPRFT